MLPWPSSAYLVEDSSTTSGYRVDIPPEAMPINADGIPVDPSGFNAFDGFPIAGTIIADFAEGVSAEGLPPHSDIAASLAADASVIVVNMTTGERLPIFAEPDMNALKPEDRALLIRPMVRMDSATRYAVGISNRVKSASGSSLPAHEGFQKILDGKQLKGTLGARMNNYEDIFASLDGAGMSKDELILAWDFVTASDESLTGDLMQMRTAALAAMGENAANLSFELTEQNNSNPVEVLKFLEGSFDVPTFLSDGEADASIVVRDEAGVPTLNGMGKANLAAVIPKCAETAQLPLPVVIFGHGMFGNAIDSLDSGLLQGLSQSQCTMVIGTDWIGLTNRQFASVAFAMNDLNRGRAISEKMSQAIINFVSLQKLLHGPLLESDIFKIDGNPIIDPTRISYFGASLGGILGSVYMAYDPDITRGAIGVPGGPWSLLFERSVFWPPLRIAMVGAYPEPWDYELLVAFMGMLFEKVDPITTSTRVIANPLPQTPAKQMFLYMAMGDALVSNIASDTLARSMKLPVTSPTVNLPFGMEEADGPTDNGYTVYDEAVLPWPPDSNALEDLDYNSTHQDVHEWKAVEREVFGFLSEGKVNNPCAIDGEASACQCDLGACK